MSGPMRVVVVGQGALGRALADGLRGAGADVRALRGRDPAPATLGEVEAVVLAVRDEAIAELAARLPAVPAAALLHCAGAYSAAELLGGARGWRAIGRLHPLVAVAEGARFEGAVFAVEGEAARALAALLGGRPVAVPPEHAALYHAAAVLAAGHVVALLDAAVAVARAAGLDEPSARAALAALARGALANLERSGAAAALTGPIARGDAAVVARHLAALPPDARELYLALARRALALSGASAADRARLAALLRDGGSAIVRPPTEEK